MMGKGKIKDVFPGGNTYKGFYSFYDYMLPSDQANRIFCIKGGPGVGKSSFMKAIASDFVEMGYDVEQHHCSSDNNSLDGIVIKQAKVAILDGTAPHVVDPKNPGAVDEILNFGAFWKEDELKLQRETILRLNKEIKGLFNSAYHYLACAKELQDDMETASEEAIDKIEFSNLVLKLKSELVEGLGITGKAGRERHLFQSALTPDGKVNYTDTIITDCHQCFFIEGVYTKGASDILAMLAHSYLLKGYDVEIYHQPLNPDRIETIVVEELGVAVTIYSKMKDKAVQVYNLDEAIIADQLEVRNDWIDTDKEMMEMLLAEAYRRIKAAKGKHDEMEKSYIPHMNFTAVTELQKQITDKIKEYL